MITITELCKNYFIQNSTEYYRYSTIGECIENEVALEFWPRNCQFTYANGIVYANIHVYEMYYFDGSEQKWIRTEIQHEILQKGRIISAAEAVVLVNNCKLS